MMKRLGILCLVLFISINILEAQNLKRRGFLGVRLLGVNDSIAEAHNMKMTTGMMVTQVFDNSTASELGIQTNDIILSINEVDIKNIPTLSRAMSGTRAEDDVMVQLIRKTKQKTFVGKIQPRPQEPSPNSEVIYDEAPYKNGYLRVIINKPTSEGKHPTVYFIPGYTCTSIDNLQPTHPYKRTIERFVLNGYAVVRVEKLGMGDSQGTVHCQDVGFFEEQKGFEAGYENLKKYDFIDQENIFIFGHSMGGVAAPLLAAKYQPKGIMVYGSVFGTWLEYMTNVVRFQNPMLGDDFLENEERVRASQKVLYEHLVLKKSPLELSKNEAYKTIIDRWNFDGKNQILARHHSFWQNLQDVNLTDAYKHYNGQVLAMYGEADIQAIDSTWALRSIQTVNHYHPNQGTYRFFPNTDHSFIKVGNMEEGLKINHNTQLRNEYNDNHYNTEVSQYMTKWMDNNRDITTSIAENTVSKPIYEVKQSDVNSIDNIIKALYDVISGEAGPRDWNRMKSLLHEDARFSAGGKTQSGKDYFVSMSPADYIKNNTPYFEKNAFFEVETGRTIEQFGNMVHIFSAYEARQTAEGQPFMSGINSIQLMYHNNRWWIVNLLWNQASEDNPVPSKYKK